MVVPPPLPTMSGILAHPLAVLTCSSQPQSHVSLFQSSYMLGGANDDQQASVALQFLVKGLPAMGEQREELFL